MRFLTQKWAYVGAAALLLTPAVADAQGQLTGVRTLIGSVISIVNILIPLLMTLAVAAFFWGLVKVLWGGGEEASSNGKTLMIWGVITLFVMVAVFGLIQFIAGNLGISTGGSLTPPTVSGGASSVPTP